MDDKGHLIARRFGGIDDYDNLAADAPAPEPVRGQVVRDGIGYRRRVRRQEARAEPFVDFELSLIYPSAKTRRPSKFVTRYQESPEGRHGGKDRQPPSARRSTTTDGPMTGFTGSPRLVKGGIVLVDPVSGAVRRIITLQYNPDSL